jgi:hypothetical protein
VVAHEGSAGFGSSKSRCVEPIGGRAARKPDCLQPHPVHLDIEGIGCVAVAFLGHQRFSFRCMRHQFTGFHLAGQSQLTRRVAPMDFIITLSRRWRFVPIIHLSSHLDLRLRLGLYHYVSLLSGYHGVTVGRLR